MASKKLRFLRKHLTFRTLRREFSANDTPNLGAYAVLFDAAHGAAGPSKKKSPAAELLRPHAKDFPLPGDVTTFYQYKVSKLPPMTRTESCLKQTDILTATTSQDRQWFAMETFKRVLAPKDGVMKNADDLELVECAAHECPVLLRKEFADLFPTMKNTRSPLSVLNLTQKTKHDMSAWSPEMEVERDELTADFVATASSICDSLKEAGYWADFIDPSSGRPYLGPFTNATFFETDERYRNFGFQVEDLGCCKVLKHHNWGTNAFVGTLFTSAPITAPALQGILQKLRGGQK